MHGTRNDALERCDDAQVRRVSGTHTAAGLKHGTVQFSAGRGTEDLVSRHSTQAGRLSSCRTLLGLINPAAPCLARVPPVL